MQASPAALVGEALEGSTGRGDGLCFPGEADPAPQPAARSSGAAAAVRPQCFLPHCLPSETRPLMASRLALWYDFGREGWVPVLLWVKSSLDQYSHVT